MSDPLFGAIEAGGTKFVCAIGTSPLDLREVRRISTSHNPVETTAEVVEYFRPFDGIRAIGIASFGPIDFASGCITTTPKLSWQNFPLRRAIERAFSVPIGFDTDVNAAALSEAQYGAGAGLRNMIYITVGTGIGGGAVVNGEAVHGLLHPEMGHLIVRRSEHEVEGFKGVCPFHGDCLEGMASGPAMQARWGAAADQLPPDHPAWRIEADYLAQACVSLACTLSPEMIVLGGGVMAQSHLLEMIRARAAEIMNGYLRMPRVEKPALPYPGLAGALMLGMQATERNTAILRA